MDKLFRLRRWGNSVVFVSKATWVSRSELMRRCRTLVEAFEDKSSPPHTRTTLNSGSVEAPLEPIQEQEASDPGLSASSPVTASAASDDLPSTARLVRGKWTYGRNVATPRGLSLRWFSEKAFTPTEVESSHFSDLRGAALHALADPMAINAIISIWEF